MHPLPILDLRGGTASHFQVKSSHARDEDWGRAVGNVEDAKMALQVVFCMLLPGASGRAGAEPLPAAARAERCSVGFLPAGLPAGPQGPGGGCSVPG